MRLAPAIHELLGSPAGIGVHAYDGSAVLADGGQATIVMRRPEGLVRLLSRPGELGLVRAYVAGDIDVDGDLYPILELGFRDDPPVIAPAILLRLVKAAGPELISHLRRLPPPPEEVRLGGRLHSLHRDAKAISHHYDVSNRFYELILGPSMTYSCAVFADPDESLEAAQARKLDLVCRKLALEPGQRLLDVGCGWGELLIHAASNYGVSGVGVTISRAQAELAAARVAEAGLASQIAIRLQDYREIDDGPFDAISSIGMFEHVGRSGIERYVRRLHSLLAEGGRLLNHAIARPVIMGSEPRPTPRQAAIRRVRVALGSAVPSRIDSDLMKRYVFPDGELHEVGGIITMLHEQGFEVRHLESLREHYSLTLRRWVTNLDKHWDEARAEVGEGRARVWKLYMSACAIGFEQHSTEIHQVLAVRPVAGRESRLPLRPRFEDAPLAESVESSAAGMLEPVPE